MNRTVIRARVLLIESGKTIPFVLCLVVAVSYCEDLNALVTEDFVMYNGYLVLNKPVSWFIGRYIEYDMVTVLIIAVISVSVNTCVWNKVAVVYLIIQLGEKEMFQTVEMQTTCVCIVCVMNIITSGFLTMKGFRRLLK